MRIITVLFLFSVNFLFAQQGCPDDQGLNYDASATINDGSCIYPSTNYAMTNIAILPDLLNEASGLAYLDNELWVTNDGGGGPDEVYRIDQSSGVVLQTILVANSNNKDWEDLAQDDTYLYIGDFGNNDGDRTNLRVYRVEQNSLSGLIANAEKISFSYPDQVDFSENHNNNDYDCEAFFYHNDSLHLFTKNWVNNWTRHYTIPTTPGTHVAVLRDSFNVNGLITAADIGADGVVSLLGYTEVGLNFMWLFYDYQTYHYFSGNKRKIDLGTALTNSQTEGLVFTGNGDGFVSSEKFNALPPRLLSFSTRQWTEDFVSSNENLFTENTLRVFPNPFDRQFSLSWSTPLIDEVELTLVNTLGEVVLRKPVATGSITTQIDISTSLANGWYLVRLQNGQELYQSKVLKIE